MSNPTGLMTWKIDRGRSRLLDKTEAGKAELVFADGDGTYDPTNDASAFYGQLDPMKQAAVAITNPMDNSKATLFRGFVDDVQYDMDVSMKYGTATVTCVDALDIFARMPMFAPRFGDTVPAIAVYSEGYSPGDIYFDGCGGLYGGTADHWGPGANSYHIGRINRILDQAGWSPGKRMIFSGNVALQEVLYDRGTTVLEALYDCCDAEFPGVANLFVSKTGNVVFHGRYARFTPANYADYGIRIWSAGDYTYSSANTALAPIAGMTFSKGRENLINSALAYAQGAPEDATMLSQAYENTSSIATYGLHSEEFKDLLVYKGEKAPRNTAAQETRLYAKFFVDNYYSPKVEISSLTFKVKPPDHPNAAALWNLICNVEISDVVNVYTDHMANGGFGEGYYVEGIHYSARPMKSSYPEIELTLDLSPVNFYANNPF